MHNTTIASSSFSIDVGVMAWTWLVILDLSVFTIRNFWGEYAVSALRGKLFALLNYGRLIIATWPWNIPWWVQLVLNIDARFEEFTCLLWSLKVTNVSPFLVGVHVRVVKCWPNCVLHRPPCSVCLQSTSVHVRIHFPGWDRSGLWLDLVNLWLMGCAQVLLAGFVKVRWMTHKLNAIKVCARAWIFDVSRGLVTARTRSSWTEPWDLNQVKE